MRCLTVLMKLVLIGILNFVVISTGASQMKDEFVFQSVCISNQFYPLDSTITLLILLPLCFLMCFLFQDHFILMFQSHMVTIHTIALSILQLLFALEFVTHYMSPYQLLILLGFHSVMLDEHNFFYITFYPWAIAIDFNGPSLNNFLVSVSDSTRCFSYICLCIWALPIVIVK